jgi:hypothetical protein
MDNTMHHLYKAKIHSLPTSLHPLPRVNLRGGKLKSILHNTMQIHKGNSSDSVEETRECCVFCFTSTPGRESGYCRTSSLRSVLLLES